MTAAQAELQGCERQLAEKQRQLDQIRSIAIRDGLEQRCNALAQLGVTLSEKGNEGVRALQEGFSPPAGAPNGIPPIDVTELFRNLPPRPSSPNGLSDASLAPSQSASQLGVPTSNKNPPLQRHLPAIPAGITSQNGAQIAEADDSSDSDHRPLEVVENTFRPTPSPGLLSPGSTIRDSARLPHRAHSSDIGPSTSRTATQMRRQNSSSSSAALPEPKKRGIFGAFTSFLRGGNASKGGKAGGDQSSSSPLKQANSAWHTRTDRNIARVRNGARDTSGSDDEQDRGRFVTIENKPGAQLVVPSPLGKGTPRRTGSVNGKGSPLVGPAPRKLTRASSTSKVPSPNSPAKKGRRTGSAIDVSTGTGPSVPPSLMRAGTVTSNSSTSTARPRTASLPGAPGVSPPNSPPPRNAARGKPLKLTGAVEKDPAAWIQGPSSPTPSHHRSPSVKSSASSPSPAKGHQRSASLDVKAPNLMTLVEDVVADRQRTEVLKPTHSIPGSPHMMLPSEYVKATTPAHGYGKNRSQSRSETMPLFAVQPPSPGEHLSRSHSITRETKGKGKEKGRHHHPQSPDITEIKHDPPSRSASPLRSALRHPASSPVHQSTGLPSKPTLVTTPGSVVAPVPIRPALISSHSMESDAASAYETAHSESSDEETDDSKTAPTRGKGPSSHDSTLLTPTARALPMPNGELPSEPSSVSGSTELGGADGVTRRKSVRLNVPLTPDDTESTQREKPLPQPGPLTQRRAPSEWKSRIADPNGAVAPDVWMDSSEEDEDYKRARRALSRVIKKEKAAHAEAIAVVASSGPSSKKRHRVKR